MNVTIEFDNVNARIHDATETQLQLLNQLLTVKDKGYYFNPSYQAGRWDGNVRFLMRPENVFPTGLLPRVTDFFKELDSDVNLVDKRLEKDNYVIDEVSSDFRVSEHKESRDYQVETINLVASNTLKGIPFYRGIINIATNGGKTVIAESIIKNLYEQLINSNKIFLFVTHSKEIGYQTKRSIEKDLKIPVGFIGDGRWDVEPVTIAMPPTLYKRMNSQRPEFKELKQNVIGFIADECLSADTYVMLANKQYMSIKGIIDKKITEVMSYNFSTRKYEPKKILRYMVTPATEPFYQITYKLGDSVQCLKATGNHKIYVANRGYVRADELFTTDLLMSVDGDLIPIQSIHRLEGQIPQYKYNLEVADNHNYFADGILVSNCHHAASDSFYKVFNNLPSAVIRLGLTGTVDKTNPVNVMKLYSCMGPVIKKISNDFLIQRGVSAKPVCLMFKIKYPELDDMEYNDAYNLGIVNNAYRHEIIYDICEKETKSNNKVLILVERIEHGEQIKELLESLNKKVYFTNGQLGSVEREDLLNKLRCGELDVLIASNILDEGVDVSGINALIYARGMRSMRKLLQGIGRGLRAKEGENILRFYDFIDDTNFKLLKHSQERYVTLEKENFDIKLMTLTKYQKASWGELMKQ